MAESSEVQTEGEFSTAQVELIANAKKNALNLDWVLGFNKDMLGGVINLADGTRSEMFYSAAHTGVIYNYETGEQRLLQGHCNPITAVCASLDRQWIVTADSGPDSLLVVWNSVTATPVRTLFSPHPLGVAAVDISPDARLLVTVGQGGPGVPQSIAIWEWTTPSETPLCSAEVPDADEQTCVRFNTTDTTEIVTNGARRVIFWRWASQSLRFYSPALSSRDLKQRTGNFTQTVFIPNSTQAMTATADGDLVIWDMSLIADGLSKPEERRAIKIIKLCSTGAITVLTLQGPHLVCGSSDGAVRFYDSHLRILAWFEDMNAGPISSISFAYQPQQPLSKDLQLDTSAYGDTVQCPDLLVGTTSALVVQLTSKILEELEADSRRGRLLLQGLDSAVHGICAHPSKPIIAVCGYSGLVQLWDYEQKRLLLVKVLDRLVPHCLAFSPDGSLLAVGCTNGTLKVLDAAKLSEVQSFRLSRDCITRLCFSASGRQLATADADRSICYFRVGHRHDDPNLPEEWLFSGKHRSHSRPLTGLTWGLNRDAAGQSRLISVGQDRRLVEYNVKDSTEFTGLLVANVTQIEQESRPSCCLWYSETNSALLEREDLVLTASDDYKLKLWNASNKSCRRTALGPTYGGAVTRLCNLQAGAGKKYLAYATDEKVVGLIKLPLDGNPNKTMGLIAHPGHVADLTASYDGKYVFTCGGSDLSVLMWRVEVEAVEATMVLGGSGVDAYMSLLEGGKSGELMQEIRDYFHYCQIRSKNENTTRPRRLDGKIPLAEIANLMRALGYYPSQQEIDNITNEVKYSQFSETGQYTTAIDLDFFIRLYVNHRPVNGVDKDHIIAAFAALGARDNGLGTMSGDMLLQALLKEGEPVTAAELETCLKALTGDPAIRAAFGGDVDALSFAANVLGFEEEGVEEEEEGGEADELALAQS